MELQHIKFYTIQPFLMKIYKYACIPSLRRFSYILILAIQHQMALSTYQFTYLATDCYENWYAYIFA